MIQDRNAPCQLTSVGSMFTLFFSEKPVKDYKGAAACDLEKFSAYFTRMLKNGIFLPPSQFESAFMGLAHSKADISDTLTAVDKSLKGL
ncbi:Glutamate-1-semialdehyde 2,1-aminomutase [hydrothermal vent metagenome]|uniref:Glutamate-1-semialdehyde 2,1-aminomutase n=1 Tax=hydrothermal vent metagenome TaxID=652676 RepID=A0A3B0VNS4_9ZZZZ